MINRLAEIQAARGVVEAEKTPLLSNSTTSSSTPSTKADTTNELQSKNLREQLEVNILPDISLLEPEIDKLKKKIEGSIQKRILLIERNQNAMARELVENEIHESDKAAKKKLKKTLSDEQKLKESLLKFSMRAGGIQRRLKMMQERLLTGENNCLQVLGSTSTPTSDSTLSEPERERMQKIANEVLANIRLQKGAIRSTARRLANNVRACQALQNGHEKWVRDRLKGQVAIVMPDADLEQLEKFVDGVMSQAASSASSTSFGNEMSIFKEQLLGISSELRHAEAKSALRDMEQQYGDLLQLERSIQQLYELFLDVQILVEMQDGMLDQVNQDVTIAVETATVAVEKLKIAKKHVAEKRKKQMIIIAIGVVCLLLVLAAILLPLLKYAAA